MNTRRWLLLAWFIASLAVSNAQVVRSEYLFDEFMDATVYFRGNYHSKEKMNYSLLANKFYFLDKEGVVKEITNEEEIITIQIHNRKFFIDKDGGVEILPTNPVLYVQYRAKMRTESPSGPYGMSTETGSTTSYTDITGVGGTHVRLRGRPIKIEMVSNVYWIEKNNKRQQFKTFRQFLKIYPSSCKEQLGNYIEKQKIDFQDVSGIIDLCKYAENLQEKK